jgi:desulfoferrodoxin (superoxide reductase-like protein)
VLASQVVKQSVAVAKETDFTAQKHVPSVMVPTAKIQKALTLMMILTTKFL